MIYDGYMILKLKLLPDLPALVAFDVFYSR